MRSQPIRLRGRFGLGLIVLLTIALATVFWAQQSASADVPAGATIKVDGGVTGPLDPGEQIDYTVTVDANINWSSDVAQNVLTQHGTFEVDFDDDLVHPKIDSVSSYSLGCSIIATNKLKCVWDPNSVGYPSGALTATIQLHFHAPGTDGTTISDPAGSACTIYDDTTDGTVNACDGAGTADGEDEVVIPAEGEAINPVGRPHTIVFNVAENVTCDSDSDMDDEVRTCSASSVNLDGATLVSGPTVSDSVVDNSATITVVINSAVPGVYDVSLNLVANSGDGESGSEVAFTTGSFEKTYKIGADLIITKTHEGNFYRGQRNVKYKIAVKNDGNIPTVGQIKVVDTLPPGLIAQSLAGALWACNVNTLTCTRSAPLNPGETSIITLIVNVAPNADPVVTNIATVSGGNEITFVNDVATDPTTVDASDLIVTKTHVGNFAHGQTKAKYKITVTNIGPGPATGLVKVVDTLPAGLTAVAISGNGGWACSLATLTCTRNTALAPGASYPVITVTVKVSNSAPGLVTNTATVSGGSESNTSNNVATDPTTISP